MPAEEREVPALFSEFPQGISHAFSFNFFNAVSFQIMLGAPIILFAKSLGASAAMLGVIASFNPVMAVFQMPAARYLGRYSYKQFVLLGWTLRTIFIALLAGIPVAWFWSTPFRLFLLSAILFVYNLLRGMSSVALLPWTTALIPGPVRGKYLSIEQLFIQAGCLASLLGSAWLMKLLSGGKAYGAVFLLSACAATISLYFLKRMPDVKDEEAVRKVSAEPIPWLQMLAYPPFVNLLALNVTYAVGIGSLAVFGVAFLQEKAGFQTADIFYLSALPFGGALATLSMTSRRLDRVGSRPVLLISGTLLAALALGWLLMALSVLPHSALFAGGLMFLGGVATANYIVANYQYAMSTIPEMGRNHFFALYTGIFSMTLGVAPIGWGALLDFLGEFQLSLGGYSVGRYGIYFGAVFLTNLILFRWISRIPRRKCNAFGHPVASLDR